MNDIDLPALRGLLRQTATEIAALKAELRRTWTRPMATEQRTLCSRDRGAEETSLLGAVSSAAGEARRRSKGGPLSRSRNEACGREGQPNRVEFSAPRSKHRATGLCVLRALLRGRYHLAGAPDRERLHRKIAEQVADRYQLNRGRSCTT